MPNAELSYSREIEFDVAKALAEIEQVVHAHDSNTGPCKGRAYPSEISHHKHLLLHLRMLPKEHRDDAYLAELVQKLKITLIPYLPDDIILSIEVERTNTAFVSAPISELRDA